MPLDRLTRLDPLHLGRFRVPARLGGGGMGSVYLAEADDGTPAAVKVIKAELAQDTQFRARFRRKVEAGRRVNSRCRTPTPTGCWMRWAPSRSSP